MFLRSCASAFRQYVKTSPRPIFRTNRRCCSSKETSETEDLNVDPSKRVNILLEHSDGRIFKEIGYVNETLYDLVKRIDKEETIFPGFGACEGCTNCATCHVILDEKYFHKLPPPGEFEMDVIDKAPQSSEFSRMSCSIHLTEEVDGMVVKFPSVLAEFYVNDESNGS